jgi:RHS repeat-associated protein
VFDGVGSVSEEVDPNGNVTAARKYDVFGSVRSGQSGTSSQKFVGSLGHVSEDSTGLIYMRARYMDPVTGRFISEDPAQDETNWFLYCGNAPTNKYDPTGCGGQIIDIGGGWWIRIDDPTSGSLPFERDLHWGNRSGDLGSVFENDTWKHFKGNLPTNRVKKAAAQAGWRGLLEGLAVCSVVAYFQQNPLDCIAILLDCAGDFDMANRVDQLNASL